MPGALTPTDPPESHHRDSFVLASMTLNTLSSALLPVSRLPIHEAEYASGVNGTPSGLKNSMCTLHLIVTNFGATLYMSGWLDLAQ
jgi:hypothetical protein